MVLQVAGSIDSQSVKWGELWTDQVRLQSVIKEKKITVVVSKPSDSVFLEDFDGDNTGRTLDGDKCICKKIGGG